MLQPIFFCKNLFTTSLTNSQEAAYVEYTLMSAHILLQETTYMKDVVLYLIEFTIKHPTESVAAECT